MARMLAWGGQPVGAGLAGVLVAPIGLVATLSIAASLVVAVAVCAAISRVHQLSA